MDRFVEQPLAPTLGGLAITRVLFDIRNHARIEDHLPIAFGIKAAIEVEIRAFQDEARLFCDVLQRVQAIWKQSHIRFIDWSDWAWRQHIAIVVRNGDDFLALLMFVPRIPNTIAQFALWSPLGHREVREDKCGELRCRELDGNRRRCRLWCRGVHHGMASCEEWRYALKNHIDFDITIS